MTRCRLLAEEELKTRPLSSISNAFLDKDLPVLAGRSTGTTMSQDFLVISCPTTGPPTQWP